jgi:hypothetical protein
MTKAALFVVSLLAIALAAGWALDHQQLAAGKKHLVQQLAKKQDGEAVATQGIYARISAPLEKAHSLDQSEEQKLRQSLRAKDCLIAKMKMDFQQQNQGTLALDEAKYQSLQTEYRIALDNGKYNYDAVRKSNRVVVEKQQRLNELWSYTRRFYPSDGAALLAVGEPLYSEATASPASYAITGNGLVWMDASARKHETVPLFPVGTDQK